MAIPRHKSAVLQRGFTLVELVMVIVILGALGGIIAVWMRGPIDAYFATGRRAALSDVADTTVRRMARDIQRALPNSVRTSGTNCLEFVPTKTGGRYRTQDVVAGDGTSLDFSTTDATFNMLGSHVAFAGGAIPLDQQIASGDLIVVYNLGPDVPEANIYNAEINANTVSGTPSVSGAAPNLETTIALTTPAKKYPLQSGGNRFHVVSSTEKLVSYVCSGSTLYRTVTNSTLSTTAACPATGAIIANNVNCANTVFNYSGSDLQRNAVVSMAITIRDASNTESASLQHQVNINNTP